MSKTNTVYIIEAIKPYGNTGKFLGGVHGISTCWFTDKRDHAEKHPSKNKAEARITDLFHPGFFKAVEV